jgi:ADP-ribose pyrophosphatase YjhB (NUDIX family)
VKTTTLLFLLDGKKILLAQKKKGPRGFGVGKRNGVGGKVEAGESIEDGAVREAKEEIGVTIAITDLIAVGSIEFIYEGSPDWDQVMHIFLTKKWSGEPVESDEMIPAWYDQTKLPLDEMWADDRYWLPKVLAGKKIKGKITFNATGDAQQASIYRSLKTASEMLSRSGPFLPPKFFQYCATFCRCGDR